MRFLKTLTINRRAIFDPRLHVDINNGVVMETPFSLTLPKGGTADTPSSLLRTNGMIRYNTDTDEVQVYQANNWRTLRFKESTGITQQTMAVGDAVNTVFGPLSPQPPTTVQSGATWGGQNLIVVVGNVFQVSTSNYVVIDGASITIGPDALGPYTSGQKYIQFTSAPPGLATPVIVLHGFDQ